MAGFKGQAEYSVDAKGRVAIPAKMRSAMSPAARNTFTVTRGFETCIVLYPQDHWDRMEEEFGGLNRYRPENRDFIRLTTMWAEECELDGQGRIALPKRLQEFAGIAEKVTIVGAFDRIEVWNPDRLQQHLNEQADDYQTLAERVLGT